MAEPMIPYRDDPINDVIHHPYTAYNQGFEASDMVLDVNMNPYIEGTQEHSMWLQGFTEIVRSELVLTSITKERPVVLKDIDDVPESCEGCGNEEPTCIKYCSTCGSAKCNKCDMGSNLECLGCTIDDDFDEDEDD